MRDRKQQNYLITQLLKRVPIEKINTAWRPEQDDEDRLFGLIRQSEADTEAYIVKQRLLG